MKNQVHFILAGLLLACAISGRAAALSEAPPTLPRPLTLDAAVVYATQNNPTLQRTREQLREREGVLVEAKSNRRPAVGLAGSASRMTGGLNELDMYALDGWKVEVSARQILYAGGGVDAKIAAQSEQVEAAKLVYTAALNDTLLAVRKQFYAVLLDRQLISVQEEALQVLEVELTNSHHRREAGTGSDFDVLRAEVAVANARPALIRVRNAYRVAQDRLRALVGAVADEAGQATDLDVQGTLEMPHREIVLADAIAASRAHRPELQQDERTIKAAEQGIVGARSGYRPTVSAVAGYEVMKPMLAATPRNHLDGWTAGVQANWTIFDGQATAGRVVQAKARLNQARYAATEQSLAIDVEVRQAHSALSEADELLVSSEKVITQARESLRLARARFEAGTATQLDVLQAQTALTEARSNLAEAQHAYAVAVAALQRAMGSG